MEKIKRASYDFELDLNDEHEKNLLTQKLLAEGWTKQNPPDYCDNYCWYYGGFTYSYDFKQKMIFKTPCGLFAQFSSVIEGGSYMGIDWSIENNCVPVKCPYYQSKEPCALNHPYLEQSRAKCTDGTLFPKDCAVTVTDEPYDYEHSVEKLYNHQHELKKRKIEEFIAKKNGHVCEFQLSYCEATATVRQRYNFQECITMGCTFCTLRQKDMTGKKVNIFYDVETKYTIKGEGLIPDEQKTTVKKNIKFTKHPITEELAKCILKEVEKELQSMKEFEAENRELGNALHGIVVNSVKVYNVRAEYKIKHDIYEDLEYIKSGIEVSYADIEIKKQKQAKSNRRTEARQKRIEKIAELYIKNGYDGLEASTFLKFQKLCQSGDLNFKQLKKEREKYLEVQKQNENKEQQKQLSFFDDEEI